jgi:S-DNA-T family DNA segregation ATPase FtsK/SpoIIIE
MASKKPTPKKKSRAKSLPKKSRRPKRTHAPEILGIILIFLSAALLLSLISYHASDPSWASASSPEEGVQNYLGKAGASVSEFLFQLFGFAGFLLPFGLFYLGIWEILSRDEFRVWIRLGGLGVLFILVCPLMEIFFPLTPWRGADIAGGGVLGTLIAPILVNTFNHIGSVLILLALLVLFLIFSTRISVKSILDLLARFFRFLFKEIKIRITVYQKEKKKEKMRRRVSEKYAERQAGKPTAKTKQAGEEKPKPEKASRKEKWKSVKKPVPVVKVKQPAPQEKLLFPEMSEKGDYNFPPISLLDPGKEAEKVDKNELYAKKQIIEEKLLQFKVEGEVREYHPGPIITTYEFYPSPGVKVSQVANLSEDLSLALGAESVRIQRIPGKSTLGIEIPNNKREIIKLRDILQTEKFVNSPSKLSIALGKTVHGEPYITDLAVMPHLLIAGATGTGKSVALNTIIASILYKASPDEVKMILIDPKRLEFTLYDGVPHLLCPVVKDPRKAEGILLDTIKKMEERYHTLGILKVRNIEQYNQKAKKILAEQEKTLSEEEKARIKPLPYIVIIIDELAELMMIGAQEVEYCIARLAQLARAVGIHLVMATQRPSTDIITGTIKNNFSSRIAFRVPSKIDSRIIIDTGGADKLLGQGDMLFMPPNFPRLLRLHSSFISLPENTRLIKFVKEQGAPEYDERIVKVLKSPVGQVEAEAGEKDPIFDKAVELILLTGQASASYLQRKLKLGYARAARVIDQMEQEGIVGPSEGSKPREILVDPETYLDRS